MDLEGQCRSEMSVSSEVQGTRGGIRVKPSGPECCLCCWTPKCPGGRRKTGAESSCPADTVVLSLLHETHKVYLTYPLVWSSPLFIGVNRIPHRREAVDLHITGLLSRSRRIAITRSVASTVTVALLFPICEEAWSRSRTGASEEDGPDLEGGIRERHPHSNKEGCTLPCTLMSTRLYPLLCRRKTPVMMGQVYSSESAQGPCYSVAVVKSIRPHPFVHEPDGDA